MEELSRKSAVLFPSGANDAGQSARETWIQLVGSWKYNALLLADFDPARAHLIHWTCSPYEVFVALISKKAHLHNER